MLQNYLKKRTRQPSYLIFFFEQHVDFDFEFSFGEFASATLFTFQLFCLHPVCMQASSLLVGAPPQQPDVATF